MSSLTSKEKLESEAAAYRHWLSVMMILQARGQVFTPEKMKDHLADMQSLDHPNFAMIQQVSVEITERTFAYLDTQDINQLWLDQ